MEKILFIGDSITEGYDTNKHLKEFGIINKGISGDNTAGVLARLQKDVIGYNPDKIFVLIGTNDFALGRSVNEIEKNIEDITSQLKNKLSSAKIYLTSVLPTKNILDRPNDKIRDLNTRIKNIAKKNNTYYFDLHSEMKDENGELKNNYTDDGLHLTEAAYQMWTEKIKQLI